MPMARTLLSDDARRDFDGARAGNVSAHVATQRAVPTATTCLRSSASRPVCSSGRHPVCSPEATILLRLRAFRVVFSSSCNPCPDWRACCVVYSSSLKPGAVPMLSTWPRWCTCCDACRSWRQPASCSSGACWKHSTPTVSCVALSPFMEHNTPVIHHTALVLVGKFKACWE